LKFGIGRFDFDLQGIANNEIAYHKKEIPQFPNSNISKHTPGFFHSNAIRTLTPLKRVGEIVPAGKSKI
jgi:hypothetical protein